MGALGRNLETSLLRGLVLVEVFIFIAVPFCHHLHKMVLPGVVSGLQSPPQPSFQRDVSTCSPREAKLPAASSYSLTRRENLCLLSPYCVPASLLGARRPCLTHLKCTCALLVGPLDAGRPRGQTCFFVISPSKHKRGNPFVCFRDSMACRGHYGCQGLRVVGQFKR